MNNNTAHLFNKKMMITAAAVLLIAVMNICASACRAGPINDGFCVQAFIESGEVTLGKTETMITDKECRVFSFTPDKDGFYSLEYLKDGCAFMEEINDNGDTYYDFYYYMRSEDCRDSDFSVTEIYNFEGGKTYKLLVMSPEAYDISSKSKTGTFKESFALGYLGFIRDYDLSEKEFPINQEGYIGYDYGDEKGIVANVDVEFTSDEIYHECYIDGSSCSGGRFALGSDFTVIEGKNTITVELYGIEKEFDINCYYDAKEFILYYGYDFSYPLNTLQGNVDVLKTDVKTGINVIIGNSVIGSPRPELGFEIISYSLGRFGFFIFRTIKDGVSL